MRAFAVAVSLAAMSLFSVVASGQNYPGKPVRIVVPFAPGGGLDVAARILTKQLSARMGQTFFVENRPGAEGSLGTDIAAKSPPDGYTLVFVTNGFAIGASLSKDLPYNSRQDLVPVAFVGEQPLVLAIGTKVPANNAQELLALAKAKPGELTFAATDPSTTMATEMLRKGMGADIRIVPYKGGGQAVIDILGGHISGVLTSFASVRQQMASNSVRAIAVTTTTRAPSHPDLPTVSESLAPGYEFPSWFLLLAPRGTPRSVLVELNKEVLAAVQTTETRELFASMALRPVPLSVDATQERLTKEFDKFASR